MPRTLASASADTLLLEIRPAMGGDDAARFADELERAYLRFAARRGWAVEPLGDGVLRIAGAGCPVLLGEAGTHRVTRIPANERNGRRHTSAVTVAALPVVAAQRAAVDERDLDIETFRASGPGGQYVNKTESAVRVVHRPTGVSAVIADDRSQHRNRERAIELVAARVAARRDEAAHRARADQRRAMVGSGHIAERRRTYAWREGRVIDHASGRSMALAAFLSGDLEPLLAGTRGA